MGESFIFLGLVGTRDTPRKETKPFIRKCHRAGITVHMLTGDHIATGLTIAKEVGILEPLGWFQASEEQRHRSLVDLGHDSNGIRPAVGRAGGKIG